MNALDEVRVSTFCLGCGQPWDTHVEYQAKWNQITLRMRHEGQQVGQIVSVEMLRDAAGTDRMRELLFAECVTRLGAETGCFPNNRAPSPSGSLAAAGRLMADGFAAGIKKEYAA